MTTTLEKIKDEYQDLATEQQVELLNQLKSFLSEQEQTTKQKNTTQYNERLDKVLESEYLPHNYASIINFQTGIPKKIIYNARHKKGKNWQVLIALEQLIEKAMASKK
jgi:CO dehydrogenase/acetyl-CoA synthase beta subunit